MAGSPRADKTIEVDPAIAAIIRNPGAPAGVPPLVEPPAELPGVLSVTHGIRTLFRLRRMGIEHSLGMRARYGEIYKAMAVSRPAVFVWNPDEIQKILRNDDSAWSAGMGWDVAVFGGIDARSGNVGALMSLDFDDHRAARKLVQPAFTPRALQGYIAIANRSLGRTIPAWIDRGGVELKPEVRTLLARVAGEIFTGITDPAKVEVIDRALLDFWHGFFAISRNPRLGPTFRRAVRGFETLTSTFRELIPERRARGGDDLFSQLCRVEDKAGLSDEAMVRIFVSVMFGAFDTTSAALTSMGYLLATHPDWQERLRAEARKIPSAELDPSRMRELTQLEWAWKETLRLMPVAGFAPRRSLREVTVSGYKLPAGTLVFAMAGAIGRDPALWQNPTTFDPERFSPERAEDRQHGGIAIPFGAGPHACVGMQLASLEMKLFWHAMLTSCRFSLARPYRALHTHTPMGCVSGSVALKLEPLR